VNSRRPSNRWLPRVLALAVGALVAMPAFAQSSSDPHIVVLRTVNPRIAYRAIPKEDMPVRAQATTFPSASFDRRVRASATELGDELLGGQSGSGGIAAHVTSLTSALPATLSGAMPMATAGSVPLGMGATLGGAGGAASQVAPTVTGALSNLGASLQGVGK